METEYSLPCSQGPETGPCPEPCFNLRVPVWHFLTSWIFTVVIPSFKPKLTKIYQQSATAYLVYSHLTSKYGGRLFQPQPEGAQCLVAGNPLSCRYIAENCGIYISYRKKNSVEHLKTESKIFICIGRNTRNIREERRIRRLKHFLVLSLPFL
jgi:hypothetical protein